MEFKEVTFDDLNEISRFQPDGWPDIVHEFKTYIEYDFCKPIKVLKGDDIVGIGTTILFGKTAWLAHIIVDEDNRNKGIGSQITVQLLDINKSHSVKTSLLIATELGEPVYRKLGFRAVSNYIYLKKKTPWKASAFSEYIVPYSEHLQKEIIDFDLKNSGENRQKLLHHFFHESYVFFEHNKMHGYWLPDLGEGPVLADSFEVGTELMKLKYAVDDHAVIPEQNKLAIDFLKKNGFIDSEKKGKRMVFGPDVDWKPEMIFGRIGGNYG